MTRWRGSTRASLALGDVPDVKRLAPLLLSYAATSHADLPPLARAWTRTLHPSAARGRADLLESLELQQRWLALIAPPELLVELAHTLDDVTRCWP